MTRTVAGERLPLRRRRAARALALAVATMLAIAGFTCSVQVYKIRQMETHRPASTTLMESRRHALAKKGRGVFATWVDLDSVPPHAIGAIIAAEDIHFLAHHGIDTSAITRAAFRNSEEGGRRYGASTITQQLARNIFLSEARTYVRKLQEVVYALWIDGLLTKHRVLELYINVAEWGDGVFGMEAASKYYFGHGVHSLTVEEAAFLAAILPSPLSVRKDQATRPPDALRRRIMRIREKMDWPYVRAQANRLAAIDHVGEPIAR